MYFVVHQIVKIADLKSCELGDLRFCHVFASFDKSRIGRDNPSKIIQGHIESLTMVYWHDDTDKQMLSDHIYLVMCDL